MPEKEWSWTAFKEQFSNELWLMLIFSSIILGTLISFFPDNYQNRSNAAQYCSIIMEIPVNIWNIFTTTFGNGKINTSSHSESRRVLTVAILLTGVVIWISYRSFLTAVLSVKKYKLPFDSPETLLKSEFS